MNILSKDEFQNLNKLNTIVLGLFFEPFDFVEILFNYKKQVVIFFVLANERKIIIFNLKKFESD